MTKRYRSAVDGQYVTEAEAKADPERTVSERTTRKHMVGREVACELVKAMGLQVEGCMSADVELPVDGIATVTLSYALTPEALKVLATALEAKAAQ